MKRVLIAAVMAMTAFVAIAMDSRVPEADGGGNIIQPVASRCGAICKTKRIRNLRLPFQTACSPKNAA